MDTEIWTEKEVDNGHHVLAQNELMVNVTLRWLMRKGMIWEEEVANMTLSVSLYSEGSKNSVWRVFAQLPVRN